MPQVTIVFSIHLFLYFCLLNSLWGGLAQETVYLTWQKDPEQTMTVQWIGPSNENEQDSVVYYRSPDQTSGWIQVSGQTFPFPDSSQYLIHQVEIDGLKPDSTYRFKISPQGDEFQFLTAPKQLKQDLRFVVGGDMYHDAMCFMAKTCRQAALTSPLFAVIGGDIAYAVKSLRRPIQQNDRWIDWIKTWHATMITPKGNMIPVIAAIGNHDIIGQYGQTPAQAAVFSHLFPMPGKQIYNVLDFPGYLSLILLDSGHANPIAGKQSKWLKTVLETRNKTPHLFAVYHVPAYPSVRGYLNKESVLIRRFWIPLFEKYGIHTVFEHHDHAYKRTFPLLRNRIHPNGIIYVGDGGWGVEKPRKKRTKRSYLAKFASARNFIAVTLSARSERYQSITDEGQIIDEWEIPLYQPLFKKHNASLNFHERILLRHPIQQ